MKAVLNKDMIVNFHRDGTVDVTVPKGVALERLRVVNGSVVDLADLQQIWVCRRSGKWELHAMQVRGAQLVTMDYSDRKHLIDDNGVYRIKTDEEINQEIMDKHSEMNENQTLRREMKELIDNLKFNKIDTHIENVFGNLNENQKTSLKKLYKVVLYLAKKR